MAPSSSQELTSSSTILSLPTAHSPLPSLSHCPHYTGEITAPLPTEPVSLPAHGCPTHTCAAQPAPLHCPALSLHCPLSLPGPLTALSSPTARCLSPSTAGWELLEALDYCPLLHSILYLLHLSTTHLQAQGSLTAGADTWSWAAGSARLAQ